MTVAVKRSPSEPERVYRPRSEKRKRAAFAEFGVVVLTETATTFDGQSVAIGASGTIVNVWDDGQGYDVEFSAPAGIAYVKDGAIAAR